MALPGWMTDSRQVVWISAPQEAQVNGGLDKAYMRIDSSIIN
jgi:hypothetical protein